MSILQFTPKLGGEFQENAIWGIPWGHHKYIIDRFFNEPEKAMFFVQKTLENGWSRNVLLNFMDTNLYERQGKAISNFKASLPFILIANLIPKAFRHDGFIADLLHI